jgi:predicted nucleotidyltransferase/HEPN domain-containing protein
MRTDVDHLPEAKRRDLERAVQILFEEFESATRNRSHPHLKNGRILKVILFGSFARGDWVADPVGGYFSDYDLLVVVDHEDLTDPLEYWRTADERLTNEVTISKRISAPVNFIVHSFQDVNRQLKRGRPFFLDILRDGVALYEAPGHDFDKSEGLSPDEALKEAEGYFAEWFESAERFFTNATDNVERGWNKEAAFLLHQSAERLYHCLLLVLTLYSPKSHKLNFLRSQAERLAPQLVGVWPRATRFEQRCFELLRRAYVDARYSPHFKITAEELSWIQGRIEVLRGVADAVCKSELERLREISA